MKSLFLAIMLFLLPAQGWAADLGIVKFGTTYKPSITQSVTVSTSQPYSIAGVPAWVKVATSGPQITLSVPDVARVPVDGSDNQVTIWSAGVLTDFFRVRCSCSTSSGCLGEPVPPAPTIAVPTATPTATIVATVTNMATGNPTPVRTATTTPVKTGTQVQATATATPTPTPSPIVPGDCNDNPTKPVRPSYRDVSIKFEDEGLYSDPYGFDARGCTATQVWMDAAQEVRWEAASEAVIALRQTFTLIKYSSEVENLGDITKRLGIDYEIARALKDTLGGIWQTDPNGKHYSKEHQVLNDARTVMLAYPFDCFDSPLMTPDLMDAMNIRKENGRCVKGANFKLPKRELVNKPRRELGTVQANTRMPALTPQQVDLLEAAHMVHHAVDDFQCGVGPDPGPGVVRDAHLRLEATARDEEEHHFLRMKDFSGRLDPKWTKEEVCKWARIKGKFHHQWMEAVLEGKWGLSRLHENNHQNAHRCAGMKAGLIVRFSCGLGIDGGEVRECPRMTCEEYLASQP